MHARVLAAAAFTAGGLILAVLLMGASDTASAADPTCSGTLDVAVHGQHIVGDYVTGIGRANIDWPPSGGVVGQAVAGQGAVIPGGPGPGFHFPEGFAPGASFCLSQSQAPGFHPGP
jgi:hypothetical protein